MMAKNKCSPLNYVCAREKCEGVAQPVTMLKSRLNSASNLFRKDLYSHYGCVNAIEFSKDGDWLVSGGDDRRVLLWNLEKAIQGKISGHPPAMNGEHTSNIFCLGFDNSNRNIFSAGNDQQVIVHDMTTGATVDVFMHEEAVYGLSVDPLNDNVFASACDDGRILIWDIREPAANGPFCLASYSSSFHAVVYNPAETRLLATANSKEGVSLWDIRKPLNALLRYHQDSRSAHLRNRCGAMSVRFNSMGTRVLALRRRLPPVLYDVTSFRPRCLFDHPRYYNSCTMKSCCFAGDEDEYVLSGSDDFNLYMWKIPEEASNRGFEPEYWVKDAHMVLKGHRSIVNQVRFNAKNFMIASSGVEKIIKVWSSFPMPGSSGGLEVEVPSKEEKRKVYTHEEYINLVLHSGQVQPMMTHDYSHQSTQEDPRMMAFFDTLVQREMEGWTSDSSVSSANTESWLFNVAERVSISEIDSSSTEDPEEEEEEEDESCEEDEDRRSAQRPSGEAEDTRSNIPYLTRISQLIAQKRQQGTWTKRHDANCVNRFKCLCGSGTSARNGEERSPATPETRTVDPETPSRSGVLFSIGPSNSSNPSDRRKLLQKRRMRILRDLPSDDDEDEDNEDAARTRPMDSRSNGDIVDRVAKEGEDSEREDNTKAKRPRLRSSENGHHRGCGSEEK